MARKKKKKHSGPHYFTNPSKPISVNCKRVPGERARKKCHEWNSYVKRRTKLKEAGKLEEVEALDKEWLPSDDYFDLFPPRTILYKNNQIPPGCPIPLKLINDWKSEAEPRYPGLKLQLKFAVTEDNEPLTWRMAFWFKPEDSEIEQLLSEYEADDEFIELYVMPHYLATGSEGDYQWYYLIENNDEVDFEEIDQTEKEPLNPLKEFLFDEYPSFDLKAFLLENRSDDAEDEEDKDLVISHCH